MDNNAVNRSLRVYSGKHNDLDTLLVTIMAVMPFLPYILSASVLIVVSSSLLIIKQTRKTILAQRNTFALALTIAALSVTSALISQNWIGIAVGYGVFLILTFAIYAREVMNAQLFKRVLSVNLIGAFTTAGAVIVQRIQNNDKYFRPYGLAFNANYVGSIAVFSAILAIVYFFEVKGDKNDKIFITKKVLSVLAVIANGVTLIICESRSSLLAIMACVFVYFILKKWILLCTLIAVCGAGIWLLGYLNPDFFGWANSLFEVFLGRYSIWLCTISIFLSSPINVLIGKGPMTYRFMWESGQMEGSVWTDANWLFEKGFIEDLSDKTATKNVMSLIAGGDHAHNIVLDTFVNVGIIGAILYFLLLSGFLKNAYNRYKSGDKIALICTVVAIVEIFVQGIPDVTIMWHQTAVLFALMCAASLKSKDNEITG